MPRQLLTNSPALAARLFVGLGIASLCSAVLAEGTAGILRYGPQLSGAPPQSLPLLGGMGLSLFAGALASAAYWSLRKGVSASHKVMVLGLALGGSGLWMACDFLIPKAVATVESSWIQLSNPSGGQVPVPPGYMEYKNTSGTTQFILEIREPDCAPETTQPGAGLFKHPNCVAGRSLLESEAICYTLYRCRSETPSSGPPRLGSL